MGKPEAQTPTAITAEDLLGYITSKDDFAFEREVFHKAVGLGLSAKHAGLYEDPVTNKPRQFDIRASKTVRDQAISLAIECKGLDVTFPLLVSCVPRTRDETFHDVLYTSDVAGAGGSYARVKRFEGAPYQEGERVGKAMRQIRRDTKGDLNGGDEVFDKWMQALASSAELITDAERQLRYPTGKTSKQVAVLPILVVSDNTLWVADYASNGRLQSAPCTASDVTFYLGREYEIPRHGLKYTDLPGFFGPLLIGDGLAPGSVVDGFIGLPAARSHGPSGPGEAPGSGADCNSWRLNSRGVSCPRLECGRTSLN